MSSSAAKPLRVGVVGAGMAGCALASKLKEAVIAPAFARTHVPAPASLLCCCLSRQGSWEPKRVCVCVCVCVYVCVCVCYCRGPR